MCSGKGYDFFTVFSLFCQAIVQLVNSFKQLSNTTSTSHLISYHLYYSTCTVHAARELKIVEDCSPLSWCEAI
jgi:hypothetical protein